MARPLEDIRQPRKTRIFIATTATIIATRPTILAITATIIATGIATKTNFEAASTGRSPPTAKGDAAMAFGLSLILINLVGGFVIGYSFRAATEHRQNSKAELSIPLI